MIQTKKLQIASKYSKGTAQTKKLSNDDLRSTVTNEWWKGKKHHMENLYGLLQKKKITYEEFEEKRDALFQELESVLKEAGVKGRRCSITGVMFYSYGNNADPFSGRCTDYANSRYVIPARCLGVTSSYIKRFGGNKAFAQFMDAQRQK